MVILGQPAGTTGWCLGTLLSKDDLGHWKSSEALRLLLTAFCDTGGAKCDVTDQAGVGCMMQGMCCCCLPPPPPACLSTLLSFRCAEYSFEDQYILFVISPECLVGGFWEQLFLFLFIVLVNDAEMCVSSVEGMDCWVDYTQHFSPLSYF